MSNVSPEAPERIVLGRTRALGVTTIAFKARPETHKTLAQVRGTLVQETGTEVALSLLLGRAVTAYQFYLDSLDADGLQAEVKVIKQLSGRRWTRKDGKL
jgi:hypothetical protein